MVTMTNGTQVPLCLFYLGFLVHGMLVIPFAVLHEFKLFLRGLPVLGGCIVAALAFSARKGDYLYRLLLSSHCPILPGRLALKMRRQRQDTQYRKKQEPVSCTHRYRAENSPQQHPCAGHNHASTDLQAWRILDAHKALDRNRTDDLILTMDVLCQLSYKGITSAGTISAVTTFVNSGDI